MPNSTNWSWKKAFVEITSNTPFPWQERLYAKLLIGEPPEQVDIPTGLGKTMVILLWLLALVEQRMSGGPIRLPRRLVYVVNRRTIVDQATELVKMIREKVCDGNDVSEPVRETLIEMATQYDAMKTGDGEPIAVSTLRGELADNQEWRQDPARAAIIIGTVDMIGSKLLFSGYGDSHRVRPLHAGLLGVDTLLVHDEAHLTPAFGKLIRHVCALQQKTSSDEALADIPDMQVMELSATLRNGDDSTDDCFSLEPKDEQNKTVRDRFDASKTMHLHCVDKPGDVKTRVIELALEYAEEAAKVVVFVQNPDIAKTIADGLKIALKKSTTEPTDDRVAILTGQIRGHERDRLLKMDAMKPFTSSDSVDQTHFLVSTSAGEVGMDLHADHMIGDLTTLDSMIQRLGRVNRFGMSQAKVDVVYDARTFATEKPPSKEWDAARWQTLQLFKEQQASDDSGINVSPKSLRAWATGSQAFSPKPEMAELTDILLDLWSQTSIQDAIPGRPEPAVWLHGHEENAPPETYLAWREETELLTTIDSETKEPTLSPDDIARWFRRCPVKARERLRLRFQTPSLKKDWTAWLESNQDRSLIILKRNGQAQITTFEQLANGKFDAQINYATLVLPTAAGGLTQDGTFAAKLRKDEACPEEMDVAEHEEDDPRRYVLRRRGEQFTYYHLGEHDKFQWPDEREEDDDKEVDARLLSWTRPGESVREMENDESLGGWRSVFRLKYRIADENVEDDEIDERYVLVLKEPRQAIQESDPPTIDEHHDDTVRIMQSMAERLQLPELIREALCIAAKFHDLGKEISIWQKASGWEPNEKMAKPKDGVLQAKLLNGYRHELGSLAKAEQLPEVADHPERDLILHVIAVHHGWSRPHFEEKAFGPLHNDASFNSGTTSRDAMLRFARLQERFGWWRLAWLESLLRRADGIASGLIHETQGKEG